VTIRIMGLKLRGVGRYLLNPIVKLGKLYGVVKTISLRTKSRG
jgi:hypothetical protein